MAKSDDKKMELLAEDAVSLESARRAAVEQLLQPPRPEDAFTPTPPPANVVGVAAGVKWRNGEPTGDPAVLVLVTHKVDKEELPQEDLVPASIGGTKTDVLEIGFPTIERVQTPVAEDGVGMVEEELLHRVTTGPSAPSAPHAPITPHIPQFGPQMLAR
ncbi:MAG: hypothetical protein KY396_06800, partial [Actinobacteria bacterium]|nr:hypothetical protein [Actinomycetota bacterium]